MKTYRELEIYKKHFFDMAEDFIKIHIGIYGEYNRDDDLIEKIINDGREIKYRQEKIKELVEQIKDPIVKVIITEKIINGNTWEKTADKIGYSLAHVQRLYKKNLSNSQIKNIMKCLEF